MDKNNVSLYVPTLDDYWYEQKLLSDLETMYYNAGYESNVEGYDYNTGCITFEPDKWKEKYESRKNAQHFIAYIKDADKWVGLVSYHYDLERKIYTCGVLIDANERDRDYAKKGLSLLIDVAKKDGVQTLYSCFEDGRGNISAVFESVGFEVIKTYEWTRFNEPTKGVLVRIKL